MQIYLAGPFFNKESKDVLGTILGCLEEQLGHQVWAPMRDGILCTKDADREMRRRVFVLDCERLHWAECVVALLDYPLPIQQQLLLRERTPEGASKDTPIFLPDPGTIFEIGYTVGMNKSDMTTQYRCVIGYKSQGFGSNLMIAEACDCIVSNLTELERVMPLVVNQDEDALLLLKTQWQKELSELGN